MELDDDDAYSKIANGFTDDEGIEYNNRDDNDGEPKELYGGVLGQNALSYFYDGEEPPIQEENIEQLGGRLTRRKYKSKSKRRGHKKTQKRNKRRKGYKKKY